MNKITNKLIVCITGMPGAGKSTVASIAKDLGFMIVNLGDFVRETALNENIEPTASNLRELMIKLRKNHGEGIMAEMASKRIIKSQSKLIVIDADDFSNKPVAEILLPQRVPFGAHGSWLEN